MALLFEQFNKGLYKIQVVDEKLIFDNGELLTPINPLSIGSGGLSGSMFIEEGSLELGLDSNAAGLSASSSSSDIVIWAGSSFEDRGTAPFRVSSDGSVVGTSVTLQTSSSGQRIVAQSSDNTLGFFDSEGQVIGIGTEVGTAIRIDLNTTTTSGVKVIGSDASQSGFIFQHSGNVASVRGMLIELSGGANQNLEGLKITHAGSGEGIFTDISGTGQGFLLTRTSGTGTDELLDILDSTTNANGNGLLSVFKSGNSASGSVVVFESDARAITLDIKANHSTTAEAGIKLTSATGGGDGILIDRNNSGRSINIDQDANDSFNTIGITMNIANAGAGVEYALELLGSEYNASATGVSGLTGVIKILTHTDGAVYIPVYNSFS